MNIKNNITPPAIKKIFGNKDNKINFILLKTQKNDIKSIFAKPKSKISINELDNWIIESWDYEQDKNLVRRMYKKTEKYLNGQQSHSDIDKVVFDFITRYPNLLLSWPCNQSQFDALAQRINKEKISNAEKDEKIQNAAIRFRTMKQLKTSINDKMEYEIFNASEHIIPTLKHAATGDFFIDGWLFDQKTTQISEGFQKNYILKHPNTDFNTNGPWIKEYGKWLYENQGEDRFDAQPRLYVLSQSNEDYKNMKSGDIEKSIILSNFETKTYDIEFYYGKKDKRKKHTAKFKVILLSKMQD